MTNRLCGTCRFFEASTLQTHGWCRNPAYPRRDELALLRNTELGCREGWGKDFWAPRDGAGAIEQHLPSPEQAPDAVVSLPIGGGGTNATPTMPPLPSPATPAPLAAAPAPTGTPPGEQDVVVGYNPLQGPHPELGENGVPLPRVRRSSVAEAHRRALERRQSERALQAQRQAALEARPASSLPPTRTVTPAAPPAPTASAEGVMGARPLRQQQPPAPAQPALGIDRVVTAEGPAGQVERPPMAAVEPPARASVPPANSSQSVTETAVRTITPPAREPDPPAPPTMPPRDEPRYWDQPGTGTRFTRFRPTTAETEPYRPEPAREARQVGRARPEPPPLVEEPSRPARTIRTLGQRQAESPGQGAPASREGRPVRADQPRAAAEAPVELPPRQVDPALLRQLEVEWREQTSAAYVGQRCGTCRYFRSGEQGRGVCEAPFAPTYRQPVKAPELACFSALGAWWAATDEGWLEKTEPRRPKRATPLLDALERELAPRVAAPAERRRHAR